MQWDDGALSQWPQTWLCGRNPAAIDAALRGEAAWLEQEYAEVKKPSIAHDRPRLSLPLGLQHGKHAVSPMDSVHNNAQSYQIRNDNCGALRKS